MEVYHYKNNQGWEPFSLTEKEGKLWNLFCQKLAIKNPKDPNPYFADYLTFITKMERDKL